MARILVVGAQSSIVQRRLVAQLVARLRRDGHDALPWQRAEEGPARSLKEADALVALLDDLPADGAAAVAFASASDKPCLGLATRGAVAPLFHEISQVAEADAEESWWAALPAFYERIRPFSGRVVRDRIPELVREAGHQVTFRSLGAEERPRFLKQKVANEARELLLADVAKEKEEIADVLEALEAFILARGFERDDLRRIKEHKRKQRGGFERAFVVEATAAAGEEAPPEATPEDDGHAPLAAGSHIPDASPAAAHPPVPTPTPAPRVHSAPPFGTGTQRNPAEAGFGALAQRSAEVASAADAEDATAPPPDLTQGRDVQAKFFEI